LKEKTNKKKEERRGANTKCRNNEQRKLENGI